MSRATFFHSLRGSYPLHRLLLARLTLCKPTKFQVPKFIRSHHKDRMDRITLTRKPCCHREPLCIAGHLYRKLAVHLILEQCSEQKEYYRQTWGSCRKTTLQVHQWRTDACHCMVSRDPQTTSRNSGNKFRLARPPTLPNFIAIRPNVCEISSVEKFYSPEK